MDLLSAILAKQLGGGGSGGGGSGGGSEPLLVTVNEVSGDPYYKLDKTAQEIIDAYESGRTIVIDASAYARMTKAIGIVLSVYYNDGVGNVNGAVGFMCADNYIDFIFDSLSGKPHPYVD